MIQHPQQGLLNWLRDQGNRVTVLPGGDYSQGWFTGVVMTITAGWRVISKEHGAYYDLPWTHEYFKDLEIIVTHNNFLIYPYGRCNNES